MFLGLIKKPLTSILVLLVLYGLPCLSFAHFQMIIPEDDMVRQNESRNIKLDLLFWHPLEIAGMHMTRPKQFGVYINGKHHGLLDTLTKTKTTDHSGDAYTTYQTNYTLKKPGDHIFYVEPQPYWEPSEEAFIIHYTKVVVNAFGLEDNWDTELGLKTEIIPLTRPYGLWAGNVFQGIVKVDGEVVPFSEVEVEFFNQDGSVTPAADPMITQVIKADANGVFTYAMPWQGWWGFAALNTDKKMMPHEGKNYPVELGAVLWVKTHDRR